MIDVLRARREAQSLTQAEVARRMGAKQPTVSAIEAPGSNPRLSTLQRYAQAVGAHLVVMAPDLREADGAQEDAGESSARKAPFAPLTDRAWLWQRFVVEQVSAPAIARELGCTRQTVYNALDRHGIDRKRHPHRRYGFPYRS